MAAVLFELPEVTIVDVNQAAERLLGYTKQEMVGKTSIASCAETRCAGQERRVERNEEAQR
ncbi:MAG: PAS domain-containing protein [Deltaproteobacteria bacterium]|nr:PAS domain-containing protein [Deltaproteobacteria bacterium]